MAAEESNPQSGPAIRRWGSQRARAGGADPRWEIAIDDHAIFDTGVSGIS
jgi:hypothetical protein|tara:strand:+ start:526 stop:675 length:150 start_codon:yes stop_codon:yes gene_type:complete